MVFGDLKEGYSDAELVTVTGEASVEQVWNHQADGRGIANALVRILGAAEADGRGPNVPAAAVNYRRASTIALGNTDASGQLRATTSEGRQAAKCRSLFQQCEASFLSICGRLFSSSCTYGEWGARAPPGLIAFNFAVEAKYWRTPN